MTRRLIRWIRNRRRPPARGWRLVGLDVFSHEHYPLPGEFETEAEARAEALRQEQRIAQGPSSPELRDRVLVLPPWEDFMA